MLKSVVKLLMPACFGFNAVKDLIKYYIYICMTFV